MVARPGGTLHFFVPKGLAEFTISAQCHWGTSQAQVTVLGPDGQTVVSQPTDPYVRSVKLTVPTGGQDGKLWALKLERVPGKSYRSLQVLFDPKLPAAVTVRPDFVFRLP